MSVSLSRWQPTFGTRIEFVGCNPATLIVFKLWDWDRFSSNDIIGEYRTSLADVLAASPPNQEWESPGDGVEVEWGGEVSARLRLKTLPLGLSRQ